MLLENISPTGLEVDQRSQRNGDDAPIAVLPQEEQITNYDNGKTVDFHDGGKHVAAIPVPMRQPEIEIPTPAPRILGLKRKTFIRLLLAVFIIILGVQSVVVWVALK